MINYRSDPLWQLTLVVSLCTGSLSLPHFPTTPHSLSQRTITCMHKTVDPAGYACCALLVVFTRYPTACRNKSQHSLLLYIGLEVACSSSFCGPPPWAPPPVVSRSCVLLCLSRRRFFFLHFCSPARSSFSSVVVFSPWSAKLTQTSKTRIRGFCCAPQQAQGVSRPACQ